MIAEIHKKISRTGGNLTDRLEDNLTGNFFGTLRYMPFNTGLKKLLVASVYPDDVAREIDEIDCEIWDSNIKFWPYDENGEIDVFLEFEKAAIGIEVKYLSGLSSDDEISNARLAGENDIELRESRQQLARESKIVSKYGGKKTKILLFLAQDSCCKEVYEDTIERCILAPEVLLGHVSWQSILANLKKLNSHGFENHYYGVAVNDLISLLEHKGFDGFRDMEIDEAMSVDESYYYFGDVPLVSFDFSGEGLVIVNDQFYCFGEIPLVKFSFDNMITVGCDLYYGFK